MGRDEEAIASLDEDEANAASVAADFCRAVRFAIQQRRDEARAIVRHYEASPTFIDPEGIFHMAQIVTRLGDHDHAIAALSRAVERGYRATAALAEQVRNARLCLRFSFRRSMLTDVGIIHTDAEGEKQ